ncbi:MAG: putative lipid II flippase FtsW [Oscillospiraceae bacterium]
MNTLKKLRRDLTMEEQLSRGPMDLPYLMLVLLLTGIGLVMVLSSSYATAFYDPQVAGNNPTYYFVKQLIFAVAGIAIMWVTSKINYQTFRWMSLFALIISIILLVLVIPFGFGRETTGAQRWIQLGPINLQPSELAKVAVILYFAARLSKRDTVKKRNWNQKSTAGRILGTLDRIGFLELLPYGAILLVIVYLLKLEPHMSGMILILAGGAAVLFAGGIKLYWFIIGGAGFAAILGFIITSTDYMTSRIELWKNPWADGANGLGRGFQTIQSLYAIGSGGLLGLGLGKSRQKFLYLPESENDFVFSIVCEELGYIGAILVLALFALLIMRGYWLALHARDRFGALLIVGINTLLAVQVFLNIGVVTNLLPTTGISLPFFSYGGTALMIQLLEMGIVLSVSRQITGPKLG